MSERLRQGACDNTMVEQLSIFQNKDTAAFRNVNSQATDQTIQNLNSKLSKLKDEMRKLREENTSLKASNDNHIYINEKLNRALQKQIEKS